MKKIFVFIIITLFLMSVISCNYGIKKEKRLHGTEEINCGTTIEDIQMQVENKMKFQEEIEKILKEKTKESVCDVFYMDCSEDKYISAFVFTGTKQKEEKNINFHGSLWYVDGQDGILLRNNMEMFAYEPIIIEHKSVKHLLFIIGSEYSTFISYIYSVKEHKPELVLETPNICFIDEGTLTIVKTFISNSANGRIWQRYYLYWDSEKEKYQEYIGKTITEEEFLSYENAQEIKNRVETVIKKDMINYYKEDSIDKIESDYIKRDNGIININYTIFCKKNIYYFYTIMMERSGKIYLETKDYDIYEKGYIFESGDFEL